MRTFFKLILVISIIGSGIFIAKKLIDTKPVAARKPVSIGSPLVENILAEPINKKIKIIAMGTVISAQEVGLQTQVSGRILKISSKLIPGGRFKKGEELLRIDDRDYKIAIDIQKASVAQAFMEFKTEKGRQSIASEEWNLLGSEIESTKEERELALRKPQLENARAAVDSAKSSLKKAELDLKRTVIKAPFNALVKDKFVDIGQYVTPGTKLITLIGTDEFRVQVSVPVSSLPWIFVPGMNAKKGSLATILQETKESDIKVIHQGKIIQLLGDLDPAGRMARLLVSIKDPLRLKSSSLPLLLGAYVKVEIYGPELFDVFEIPRKALRENDHVWLISYENKLIFKKILVKWRSKNNIIARGLEPGDKIITSRISAPVNGMDLRIASESPLKRVTNVDEK
ncbi:Efflux RND transporter periplasmic adaptor subunit [Candidatus Magnetomoraceae bacterium gMMP-13]